MVELESPLFSNTFSDSNRDVVVDSDMWVGKDNDMDNQTIIVDI